MKCKLSICLFVFWPFCLVFADRVFDLADVPDVEGLRIDTFFYDLDREAYLDFGQFFDESCSPCRFRATIRNSSDHPAMYMLRVRAYEGTRFQSNLGAVLPLLQADRKNYYILQVLPQSVDTLHLDLYQPAGIHFFCRVYGYPEVLEMITGQFPTLFNSERFFEYGFYAILLIVASISLIYFWFLRYNHFLYYTLYIVIVFLFFYIQFTAWDAMELYHVHFYQISSHFGLPLYLQCLFYLAYFAFVSLFLNTKENYPLVHKLIRFTVAITLLYMTFAIIYFLLTGTFTIAVFTLYRVSMVVLGLVMITVMLNKKSLTTRLIVIGSIFLFLGSVITFYTGTFLQSLTLFGISRTFYMQTGVLLEVLFFTMAVAYKTHLEIVEKNKYHTALNDALQRIQKNAIEKEKELKAKIEEATLEISEKEAQKMHALLELKEKDLEMQVLRAQINPHFVFNSINALKILIHQRQNEDALLYFEKFSKLLRLILENTHERKVTLAKELKTIKLYVEIENLRLKHPVALKIQLDESIDPDFTMLPAMLLQPFVENAIWHGLSHREKAGGSIEIHARLLKDETLQIDIADNGIGRKAAAQYKSDAPSHRSLGSLITEKRLNLYNEQEGHIQYIDLVDANGKAIGTKVSLSIMP